MSDKKPSKATTKISSASSRRGTQASRPSLELFANVKSPGSKIPTAKVSDIEDSLAGSMNMSPEVRRYLPTALSRLTNALNLMLLKELKPMELSVQQFRVIQVVATRGVASINEITADAVIEQSVASRIVAQLVNRGFVRKQVSVSNARTVEVSLTAVGAAVYSDLMVKARAIVDDATSALAVADNEKLVDMLYVILNKVKASQKIDF